MDCPGCSGSGVQKRSSDGLKVICPICNGAGEWDRQKEKDPPKDPPKEKDPPKDPLKEKDPPKDPNPNDPDQIEKRVKKSLFDKIFGD